jgi:4-amino-4-deoxy-L-arabinose transferase-like glycosyltransferase
VNWSLAGVTEKKTLLLEAFLLLVLTLGLRLIELGHPPYIDELQHILAARSLLSDGSLSINGGEPYVRATLFTYMVAGLFTIFGESLQVARLPSVLAGTALLVVLFLWVRAIGGRAAGWLATVPAAIQPNGIFLAQLSRFYTLQVLFFLLGTIAVYQLVAPPGTLTSRARWRFALAALTCFVLALYFQITCAVGIAAVMIWATILVAPTAWRWLRTQRHAGWILAGGFAFVLLAAVLAVASGVVAEAVSSFGYVDRWAADQRGNVRFYHWLLLDQYPSAWTLFPVVFLVAAAGHLRMATLCAIIFGLAFVFHSVAAWKHDRYIAYAMPMFFALIGLAAAQALPALRRAAESVVARLAGASTRPMVVRLGAAVLLAGCVFFIVIGNGAFPTAVRMLAPASPDDMASRPFRGQSDWGSASAQLLPIADTVAVVVASSDMKSIYYLGRVDFILEAQRLFIEGRWWPEFTIDEKVARPSISTPESLRRITECVPSGLIIAEYGQWRQPWGIPAPMADYLEKNTEQILKSDRWRLRAFRWSQPVAATRPDCLRHPAAGASADTSSGTQ